MTMQAWPLDAESERRLREIESLGQGWLDGSGDEIHTEVVRAATNLLKECHRRKVPSPVIGPTEDGEISLHWDGRFSSHGCRPTHGI